MLLSRFIQPGDTLVAASSSQSLAQTFAVRIPGGLRVMAVNDDPLNGYSVSLPAPGYRGQPWHPDRLLQRAEQCRAVPPGQRWRRPPAVLDHHVPAHPEIAS